MLIISPYKGARGHRKKRVGRGFSSGIGKTCTRGTKGQNARKSGCVRLGFEGGQLPLYRKVGKYGFNNYEFRRRIKAINIKDLDKFEGVDFFDRAKFMECGLVGKKDEYVKLIGDKTKLSGITFEVDFCSKNAERVLKENKNVINFVNKK